MFETDINAPRIEVDEIRELSNEEAATLLDGARDVCESIQDNDMEKWSYSLGGQFIRQTGKATYVTDAAYAFEFLDGFCDEKVMRQLADADAFGQAARAPSA